MYHYSKRTSRKYHASRSNSSDGRVAITRANLEAAGVPEDLIELALQAKRNGAIRFAFSRQDRRTVEWYKEQGRYMDGGTLSEVTHGHVWAYIDGDVCTATTRGKMYISIVHYKGE